MRPIGRLGGVPLRLRAIDPHLGHGGECGEEDHLLDLGSELLLEEEE